MTGPLLRSAEIQALSRGLAASGRVRVQLPELVTAWVSAAPRLVGHPEQLRGLLAALRELADQGVIELPVTAWDTSTTPPLPRSVTVISARRPARERPWIGHPWSPAMGWVSSLAALSKSQYAELLAIDDWLLRHQDPVPLVPMRYRSAELFGAEKRLEQLVRGSWFGPGRLSLTLLRCVRRPPPLAAAVVGPGADVFVSENSDTYWAAVDVLSSLPDCPIGIVAWGAGRAFPSQVPTLAVDVAGRGPVRGTVWYWGDCDPDGLAIAADAAGLAAAAGGPEIRPAAALWAAMADQPVRGAGTVKWTSQLAQARWLGHELSGLLRPIKLAQGRVAQEAVPVSSIQAWARTVTR